MTVFAPGIPGFTAMAAAPWLFGGAESGLPIAGSAVGLWMIVAIPLVFGMKSRRYWGVMLYFYTGLFCAISLPISLILLATLYLSTLHHQPPDYYFIIFGVGLVAMVPFWPLLVRALRLKYWQPWTRPNEWEVGDEWLADWVFDAAGVPRAPPPSQAAQRAAPAATRAIKARRRR